MKKYKYESKVYFIPIIVLVLLLSSFTVFAMETTDIEWITDYGEVILADDLNQEIYAVYHKSLNDVTVSFDNPDIGRATLLIVPVTNGITEKLTERNAIYMGQAPVEQGVARFSFYLTSDIQDGIYALMVGGIESGYSTRYFKVNTKRVPQIKDNQVIQYDDYKEKIMLKFEDDSDINDIIGISQDENTSVRLSYGEKSVDILSEDIFYDAENKTISINTQNYTDIFPAIGEKHSGGNIQRTTISISSPDFWGDEAVGGVLSQTFGLVIREFSAEGFKNGMDFDIDVCSYTKLENVRFLVALFDDGKLVASDISDLMTIEANINTTISIQIKNENIEPSGKFSVKVFMWDDESVAPYVSEVSF